MTRCGHTMKKCELAVQDWTMWTVMDGFAAVDLDCVSKNVHLFVVEISESKIGQFQ